MNLFPKWKYHATEEGQIVESADAEKGLPAGWYDTPAEALKAAGVGKGGVDTDEVYRKELLEKAKAMGLSIHHMTGTEKIVAAIAAHSADQNA